MENTKKTKGEKMTEYPEIQEKKDEALLGFLLGAGTMLAIIIILMLIGWVLGIWK